MDLETLRNNSSKILSCDVQDQDGLNDFQKLPDKNAIRIDKVGIERFRIPLKFSHENGESIHHDCEASMFVSLQEGKTGVNMSRFCQILQNKAEKIEVGPKLFETVINAFRSDLRDYDHEDLIENAYLKLDFNFPVKQKSLKSDNWGWQYYKCSLSGQTLKNSDIKMSLKLHYEYSSTCPCSLSMSKQYEREYKEGKTTEGKGIAVAHSQRSEATCEVDFLLTNPIAIEEVVRLVRTALPTETQSLVKRVDEQAFAILNGENPMFVEHASRRLAFVLDSEKRIIDWKAKVEHIESLHSHNAVAYIKKSFPKN